MMRKITYAEALKEAQEYCLENDKNTLLMGLGVPDPKGIFGSTLGLQKKFGSKRVFDIPLSENALTGVAIGVSIVGMRPILTHQRIDFALVSIEQIVNQAAKWHYMFDGKMNVPIVIRMVIGRGWGQGPQHSQSLQSWFAHIPGLKVIMPTTPYDAKGMMIKSIEDNNPVICLEHRWLYNITDKVPEEDYRIDIDKAKVLQKGKDITILGVSYMTLESLKASEELKKIGVSSEIIDLRSIKPIDIDTIFKSVRKTGRLLIVDTGHLTCGISSEIITLVSEKLFKYLKTGPQRLGLKDYPTPTSHYLSKNYYPLLKDIIHKSLEIMNLNKNDYKTKQDEILNLDQPDSSFQGPF